MHEPVVGGAPDAPQGHWDLRPFQLLREGWVLVKPHYLPLLAWLLGGVTLLAIFRSIPVVGAIGIFLVVCTFNSGVTWFLLQRSRREPVDWLTFLQPMVHNALPVMGLHILAALLIVGALAALVGPILYIAITLGGGLILLLALLALLPGLYLAVAFELSLPLLLAQDLSPWQALVRSRQCVHQQLGDFLMLSLALVTLNGTAALLFALPLAWTLPATCGAGAVLASQVLGWRSSFSA